MTIYSIILVLVVTILAGALLYYAASVALCKRLAESYARSACVIEEGASPTNAQLLRGLEWQAERLASKIKFLDLQLRDCGLDIDQKIRNPMPLFRWAMYPEALIAPERYEWRRNTLIQIPHVVREMATLFPMPEKVRSDLIRWSWNVQQWTIVVDYLEPKLPIHIKAKRET